MKVYPSLSLLLLNACIVSAHDFPAEKATVRHIESKGIGYREGYTTFEGIFTASIPESRFIPFLDMRGHLFNNGYWAANGGLGLRFCHDRIWGINGYYDFRGGKEVTGHQIGIGIETLGEVWDARMNGYIPIRKTKSDPRNVRFEQFKGHQLLLAYDQTKVLGGCDLEGSYHFTPHRWIETTASVGSYYFVNGNTSLVGVKGRLTASIYRYVDVEVIGSYDHRFKGIIQGQVAVNIPFGASLSCCSPCIKSQILQRVDRQEIIVKTKTKKTSIAQHRSTHLPYHFVFVDNTSHSKGTFESPASTLFQAEQISKKGDILYLFPGDGTTKGMDRGVVLKDDQQILGANRSYLFETTLGDVRVPRFSTTAPKISHPNGIAISLADRNRVSGLDILNCNGGIYGVLTQGAKIDHNQILAPDAAFGIDFINASNAITIKNNLLKVNHPSNPSIGISINNIDTKSKLNISRNALYFHVTKAIHLNFSANATGKITCSKNLALTKTLSSISTDGIGMEIDTYENGSATASIFKNTLIGQPNAGIKLVSKGIGSIKANIYKNFITAPNPLAVPTTLSRNGIQINAQENTRMKIKMVENMSRNQINAGFLFSATGEAKIDAEVHRNLALGTTEMPTRTSGLTFFADNFAVLTTHISENKFYDHLIGIKMQTKAEAKIPQALIEKNTIVGLANTPNTFGMQMTANTNTTAPVTSTGSAHLIISENRCSDHEGASLSILTDYSYSIKSEIFGNLFIPGQSTGQSYGIFANTKTNSAVHATIDQNTIGDAGMQGIKFDLNSSQNIGVKIKDNTIGKGGVLIEGTTNYPTTGSTCLTLKRNVSRSGFTLENRTLSAPQAFTTEIAQNEGGLTFLPSRSDFNEGHCQ